VNLALVLTGGGARAAYQVGALTALAELFGPGPLPFPVVCGVSAGAINGSALAAQAENFPLAVRHLADTWLQLTPDQVYRTDSLSLVSIGSGWFRGLTSGGRQPPRRYNHLLDTEPLRALLDREINFPAIQQHVASGLVRGVAVSATNYVTGTSVSFFDAASTVKPWARSRRLGVRGPITVDQVMASAAIPIFFPPVKLGGSFFGDGGVRLNVPQHREDLPLSQILGVLMNAVFLDSLEADIERVERVTAMIQLLQRPEDLHLRPIQILLLQPSQDLGEMAADQVVRFPRALRFLLKGLGASQSGGADLLSYLAFEHEYIERLVKLGAEDTRARSEEVRAFLGLASGETSSVA